MIWVKTKEVHVCSAPIGVDCGKANVLFVVGRRMEHSRAELLTLNQPRGREREREEMKKERRKGKRRRRSQGKRGPSKRHS